MAKVKTQTIKRKATRQRKSVVTREPAKKEIFGAQQVAVEQAKFYPPQQASRPARVMPQELPFGYGQDKIILQVRDPWWIHAYWEVRSQIFDALREQLKDDFYKARRVLRVYDVSYIIFNGKNANRFFDIHIHEHSNNWYIDTGGPGRSWCVDFGLLLADGRFITIVRSNTVATPLAGPSWITDEEWMIPDDAFARLYGMGFGFGRSSPVGKAWQERLKKALFSGVFASPGMASPVKKIPGARKFWLAVNTELIVYGATEPDAKVTVQGNPINLRPDGTFTLRFALPDGKQVIPVKAVSCDNQEERAITPVVNKETK
ncbi:MAG: DUF4912 domain-containing protein [Candidatus Omnitrophica bacterium]|nr:DUF4912 domain-containing protein [Candidatus Omnitrophota bacterium]